MPAVCCTGGPINDLDPLKSLESMCLKDNYDSKSSLLRHHSKSHIENTLLSF